MEYFRSMIMSHGKAFAFKPSEIGCVDPQIVEPMIIFTVLHIPWNFKPIPVPRAHMPQLVELLKEKIDMEILECPKRMDLLDLFKICSMLTRLLSKMLGLVLL